MDGVFSFVGNDVIGDADFRVCDRSAINIPCKKESIGFISVMDTVTHPGGESGVSLGQNLVDVMFGQELFLKECF